jgi:hypothetical protein
LNRITSGQSEKQTPEDFTDDLGRKYQIPSDKLHEAKKPVFG